MTDTPLTQESRDRAAAPAMWSRQGPYLLDWASFGVLVDDLADQVRADGFVPDAVLALARGGLTPAGHLTCALDVPVTHVVRVRRTADDSRYATKNPPVIDSATPLPLGAGRRVLVVDDIVGTGETAAVVLGHLAAAGVAADDVRFAAVVRNHQSSYVPEYCAAVIDDWIVFPWETARESTADCRPFPAALRVRT
ncbi:phosphoribosyltransferase [Streptomyces alboflavus]|uniref:phosphoribosyltransferase n=1 Tax=Streptomyces alboflavus TaxID=67267 RepID=UPI00068A8D0B|nr:phosphoribosyltransferase family protein [Streptomyces alboflavus]